MKMKYIFLLAATAVFSLNVAAQDETFEKQVVKSDITGDITLEESTAAISVITAEDIEHRTSKNIGNSIIGQGLGLISLQGAGNFSDMNPTFYVRGLQTLNSNYSPLILVDGIEREIKNIAAEEIASVSILKDAAAVALYGYKGINGAILLTSKRGESDTQKVKFSYDHQFNSLINVPEFVNGYTYGLAINEALANDGLAPRYNSNELGALRSGFAPYYYPNVNWVDEVFKNTASTNNFNMEFSGGQGRFRYFTMLSLISDKGFINNSEVNDGYSTQDKFVRGNMRMNMDIDLTKTTDLKINILGMLLEDNRPGSNINPWDLVYTVPSAAMPIMDNHENRHNWAGSNTWDGTKNPVGQTRGAAYYKNHNRMIFSDVTLKQDLSSWTPGLSAYARAAYDIVSNLYENHSKTYLYSVYTPTWAEGAAFPTASWKSAGADSAMGSGHGTTSYNRRVHVDFGVNYDFTAGDNAFKTQLKYDYDYEDINGTNQTIYRHNVGFWGHYSYAGKFLADLTLMESGTNRLAPGSKWNLSPTLSLGWVLTNCDFLSGSDAVNFLKLRASAGILNADYVPGSNVWSYYAEQYSTGGTAYPFTSSYTSEFGATTLGRIPTANPSNEKAMKANFGIDARLFGGLTVTADAFYQRRSNIWVSADGKYSKVLGRSVPYENGGIVDSWGAELGLNYNKTWNDFTLDLGGNIDFYRSKIVDMYEEPRLYENLVQTGNRVGQTYGLKAIGFFKDAEDIANSPEQTFSIVAPGDIKYEDVNKDGKIDANDVCAIGYSTTAPELFYNFHLGFEWKGLGFYALFQGAGRYSAVLNTKSMYWPLIDNTNISKYAYENRWTPSNPDALFPRLSSQSNDNNYQTNTLWLADRSFLKLRNVDLYYNLPESLLNKTKFIKGVKIYASGNDLFSFDNFAVDDPEAYGTAQLFRSIVAGVKLTF